MASTVGDSGDAEALVARWTAAATSDDDVAALFTQHGRRLARLGLQLTGSTDEADDLVIEAFARALPRLRSGQVEYPRAYLEKTLVNLAVSRRRLLLRRRRITESLPQIGEVTPDGTDGLAHATVVWTAVRRLPAGQRAVVVLRYGDDRTEREVADILGVSVGTVKSQCARALSALRSTLAEEPDDG